jgi:DNA-binding NarL/FixJ family response regulator
MTVSVLIADDHPIFRRGLRDIIEETERFRVVGEVSDGVEALNAIREHRPMVALLDIAMPKVDGLQVIEQMSEWRDKPTVVLLTMYDDYVASAMRLGAAGYLLKENAEDTLIACLETVLRGERFVSEGVHWTPEDRAGSDSLVALTPSERRILKLTAELKTSREIGKLLCISYRTVQNHRANMCGKLGLQGNKALLRFALRYQKELSEDESK